MAAAHDRTDADDDAGSETPGQVSDDRDKRADDRDETAVADEMAAEARDDRADARDDRAEARDEAAGSVDARAASDRAEALQDRRGAARDRSHAATDRAAAGSDRARSAGERMVSSIDGLTGVYRRDSGIVELEREMGRAKRIEGSFVLAFIDVDGLKATNDSLGHAAGDQLLSEVADTLRANLRSYDLIVRFGGDEFVCGLPGLTMEAVAERFRRINAELAEAQQASVTFGLAQLEGDGSLEDLIAGADAALYRAREQRPSARA